VAAKPELANLLRTHLWWVELAMRKGTRGSIEPYIFSMGTLFCLHSCTHRGENTFRWDTSDTRLA